MARLRFCGQDRADDVFALIAGGKAADMLHEHLRVTTEEAAARVKKDWAGDVKAYDAIHKQAMMMADALSSGIIKQFPYKFKRSRLRASEV